MVLFWVPGQFELKDLFISFIAVLFLLGLSTLTSPKSLKLKKYFYRGLLIKIIGGLLFWLVYCQVYNGGDSWSYFKSSKAISKLLVSYFPDGYKIIIGEISHDNCFDFFNYGTGFPAYYMTRDSNTFMVARICSIFSFITFNSFMTCTILVSSFSFMGVWRLFKMVTDLYPKINEKHLFYIIICTPSLLFWGGGIMKDTFVLNASCWIAYNFYMFFVKKEKRLINALVLFMNIIIIINIKSYILISLIPGLVLWLNNLNLKNIKNPIFKILFGPLIIIFFISLTLGALGSIGEYMGEYKDIDSAIMQAKVIQEDLLREEAYGSNSYNIGEIDGSFTGLLRLAPIAIFTSIFRPLPWEIGSPMMVISVFENLILLFFTISLLLRLSPYKFFKEISKDPFLAFAFIFSMFFSFGVGVASTNFGALVRYKIPLIPFLFVCIYIIYSKNKIKKI